MRSINITLYFLIILLLICPISTLDKPNLVVATDESQVQKIPKLQGNLDQYMETGVIPTGISKDSIIAISNSNEDLSDKFYPRVKIGENYIHFLPLPTPTELRKLYLDSSIITLIPDQQISYDSNTNENPELSSFESAKIMQLEETWNEFGITGEDVILGIVDSGVDFGNSDLVGSALIDPNGYTASFDPTGDSIVFTNLTLSPYQSGNDLYLPLEGETLFGRNGPAGSEESNDQYGIELNDLEITNIEKPSKSNNYKVGLIIQPNYIQDVPWQVFIFVLTDSESSGIYDTVYVDLDTSLALTLAYNGLIFESGETYLSLVDWSISDEEYFNKDNPIIARDINGDGVNDISAGALATAFNWEPSISSNIYIRGIETFGRGMVLMYDYLGHGTSSAGAAVSRGNVNYTLYDDKTTKEIENPQGYTLPGSAPGAKIIATKGLTVSDYVQSWFWIAGMEVSSSGEYDILNTAHRAEITSNSWGDTDLATFEGPKGMDFYSFMVDLLSVEDLLYDEYPGMLFVISSGNGGPGYGTVASPGAASLGITVGASNNYIYLNNSGKNDVAWFSARGPTAYGVIKPDIVAPGNTGYTTKMVIEGYGDGVLAAGTFGGTSEAAPRAAGVVALIVQALKQENIPYDIGIVRSILKSTAIDLGYHHAIQGNGLVNAYHAVSSVLDGDELIISSRATADTIGSRLDSSIQSYFGIEHPLLTLGLVDAAIQVDPAQLKAGIDIDVNYGNGSSVDLSNTVISSQQLVRIDSTSFNLQSKSATVSNYNLEDLLPANFRNSELLQISMSLDEKSWNSLLDSGLSSPEMLLYDENTGIYVYNSITQRSYIHQLYSGKPSDDFSGSPILSFTDPGYTEEVINWSGLNYTIFAQTFDYNPMSINAVKGVGKITLTSDLQQTQFGSIFINETRIPIFISQIENVGYMEGAGSIDTFDDYEVPYNLDEAYATHDWGYRPESGDFRFYQFLVPSNATFFVVQVSWEDSNLIPDLFLYNDTAHEVARSDFTYAGGGYYESIPSEENKQNIIVKADPGTYTLMIHFAKSPFKATPTQFDVKTRYLTVSELPKPTATFSQDPLLPISGAFSINVNNYTAEEFPELKISGIEVEVTKGQVDQYQDTFTTYDQEEGVAEDISFVEGSYLMEFEKGERVDIALSWPGNVDFDIYVLNGNDPYELEYDLLDGQGTFPGTDFEYVSFAASEAGVYFILVDFVASETFQDVSFNLMIDSRKGPIVKSNIDNIEISSSLFPNDDYLLRIKYLTNFGVEFSEDVNSIFENHNPFTSSLLSPEEDDTLNENVLVSWEASVKVTADISLEIDGISFLLANGIDKSNFTFDSSVYRNGNAKITVKLTNGVYENIHSVSVVLDNRDVSTLPPVTTTEGSLPIPILSFLVAFITLMQIKKRKFKEN